MSFAKEIWDKFSTMDVNAHTEKRGQFTFLSWTWAWSTLMEVYPESYVSDTPPPVDINGSMEVRVSITVKDGDRELTRSMWLPVMDFKNNAVKSPLARDVSDARMRCLVKCLAMFGLGHYIYAGQDLPVQPKPKAVDPKVLEGLKATISEYEEQGIIPPRRLSWLNTANNKKKTGWERITEDQARTIISECKQLEQAV